MSHPMPGQTINGATVVASAVYNDDIPDANVYSVLLLNAAVPLYSVQVVTVILDKVYADWSEDFVNIVAAVTAYKNLAG